MEELKNPFKLTSKFWKQVGALVLREVRKDTKAGLFQNNLSKLRYKSLQYVKYKANQMIRYTTDINQKKFKSGDTIGSRKLGRGLGFGFVDRKTVVRAEDIGFGKGGVKRKGTRLKAYEGKKIESTNVAYVDMTLTGETMAGFHVKAVDPQGVTMAYNPPDTDKIIGNRKHGYDIVGLNDKNRMLVKNEILKELGLSAKEHKKITINVSL